MPKVKQKKSTVIMLGVLVVVSAFTGWTFFSQDDYDDFSTMPSQPSGNVTESVMEDGTIKKTINVPPPRRARNIKTVQDVVNDYILSSPNKENAIASLQAAFNIPQADNLMKIAQLKSQTAEYEFKTAEWKAKSEQVEEHGVNSLKSAEEPKIDDSVNSMGYFKRSEPENNRNNNQKKRLTVELDDFKLLGIVGERVAKLSRLNQSYSVKTGYVLHGDIKVKVTENGVTLSNKKRSVNLYLD